jgi:hypothetical protein
MQTAQKLLQNCDAPNQIVSRAMHGLSQGNAFEPNQGLGSNALGLQLAKSQHNEKA